MAHLEASAGRGGIGFSMGGSLRILAIVLLLVWLF